MDIKKIFGMMSVLLKYKPEQKEDVVSKFIQISSGDGKIVINENKAKSQIEEEFEDFDFQMFAMNDIDNPEEAEMSDIIISEYMADIKETESIPGHPDMSFDDILEMMNPEQISMLSEMLIEDIKPIGDPSDLKPYLLDRDLLTEVVFNMTEEELNAFFYLMWEGSSDKAADYIRSSSALIDLNMVSLIDDNGHYYVVMTEEVRRAFADVLLNVNDLIMLEVMNTYRQYVSAAINLYGLISFNELKGIIYEYEDDYFPADMAREYLTRFDYAIYGFIDGDYIIHFDLEEAEKVIDDIKHRHKKIPRYLPVREELLKYAQDTYVEQTPELAQMIETLEKCLVDANGRPPTAIAAENFVDEIQLYITRNGSLKNAVEIVQREGYNLNSKDAIGKFSQAYMNLTNNTRLWINNGHTPEEIGESDSNQAELTNALNAFGLSGASNNFGSNVIPIRKPEKIGRNDPCPCGSGKKYKNCCLLRDN